MDKELEQMYQEFADNDDMEYYCTHYCECHYEVERKDGTIYYGCNCPRYNARNYGAKCWEEMEMMREDGDL